MSRVIVITSGKGGVGKTTTVAGLGVALARNHKVVLVDADVGLNNLDVALNIESSIVFDLGDVIEGRARLNQALVKDPIHPQLYILASGNAVKDNKLTPEVFKQIITELETVFDYVLIDCPAGIEEGFRRAVSVARECVIVTTPHVSAIRDADKVAAMIAGFSLKIDGLIICRVKPSLIRSGRMIHPREISSLMRIPLLGYTVEDDKVATVEITRLTSGKNIRIYEDIAYKLLSDDEKKSAVKWYRRIFGNERKAL